MQADDKLRYSIFGQIVFYWRNVASDKAKGNGIILGLLLLAFALRLHKVTSVPLGFDEIRTIFRYVPLPLVDIFKTVYSNNQPMASVLAHVFSPQADHLFMMRWPMILLGMLSLPFAYRLSSEIFGQKVGGLTILLIGISPVHIGYSVIIRGYIGLISLTTVSLYLLWRALQYNRWRHWLGFGVINVLIIYFHLFSILAVGTQLGLICLWIVRDFSGKGWRSFSLLEQGRLKPPLLKFGVITSLLIVIYSPLIYAQTTSIFSEGGYLADFEVWRDGVFSLSQDISPIAGVVTLMAPMSPGNLGMYLYLVFGAIGLISLRYRQQTLAVAVVIWFVTPFIAIYVAMQVLGSAFYVYTRFLLYLLPVFLTLVAAGLVTFLEWLSTVARKLDWPWSVAVHLTRWSSIAGLLTLAVVSVNWYMLTSTHADWQGIANVLLDELQPQDITICEEYRRGFDIPDRAKPYCTWMLDFFLPQLKEYTPHFQSSTDFIANYDHLQEQREVMLRPGSVWLVMWQKVVFHPGYLVTDARPPIALPPPLSIFEPYRTQHFGSATLVHIDSEETLFGNVYKALELLLKIKLSPADKARYYRSLAQMEAIQGHKRQAREFFEKSWNMVERAGGIYPESFLGDIQAMIDRIPDNHSPGQQSVQVGYPFGSSLCLQAYEVWPEVLQADRPLTLTLYWQTLDFVNEDYTFFLRLNDELGQSHGQLEFEPFDRTYPTPWWWAGQQVVERREFVVPADLSLEDQVIYLGARDRQSPDDEVVAPLFFLAYQPEGTGSARWAVKKVDRSDPTCP